MKFCVILMCLCILCLSGCFSPTASKVTFYDKDGKIVKVVEAEESLVKTIVRGYKDHSVIWYDNGWHMSLKASMTTTETPFPTIEIAAGKNDKATFILHRDHNLSVLPDIIKYARADDISTVDQGNSGDVIKEPILISGKSPKTLTNPIYAWANGTDIIYTVRLMPKVGDVTIKVTVMTGTFKKVGPITAIGENSIVVDKKVYLRQKDKDKRPTETTKALPLTNPTLDSVEMVMEASAPDNVVSPESVLKLNEK